MSDRLPTCPACLLFAPLGWMLAMLLLLVPLDRVGGALGSARDATARPMPAQHEDGLPPVSVRRTTEGSEKELEDGTGSDGPEQPRVAVTTLLPRPRWNRHWRVVADPTLRRSTPSGVEPGEAGRARAPPTH